MGFNDSLYSFLGMAKEQDINKIRELIISQAESNKKTIEELQSNISNDYKKTIEELQEQIAIKTKLLDSSTPSTTVSSIASEGKSLEDVQGTVKKRVPIKNLQLLYLNNQYIFRGVNFRADELISRGYKILKGDEIGQQKCIELINRSGRENLFWQISVTTDVCGDGYLEKVFNLTDSDIVYLKHINPINFGFLTEKDNLDKIEIDPSTKKPKAYMQVTIDKDGKSLTKEISKDKIIHVIFNTFSDEFNGISSIQPVYSTAIRLMNMENAAAEAAVKTANPTWVVYTTSKSPQELMRWQEIMGRVSAQDVIFLPDGVTVELKSPGSQNFSAYSDYFLGAVVSCLGVPRSVLTGSSDSSGGNRSTVQTLSKHFYSVIRSNQRYIEDLFNKLFEEYGELAGFEPPVLLFNDIAEDADRNGQRAVELFGAGLITLEEARDLLGLETPEFIRTELEKEAKKFQPEPDPTQKKLENEEDMKAWHPAEPGSVQGSQKNEKRNKKFDPNVPSVR